MGRYNESIKAIKTKMFYNPLLQPGWQSAGFLFTAPQLQQNSQNGIHKH
jgi:hypothetical protein